MKLRTLALCLALAACNKSSSVESASGTAAAGDESSESAGGAAHGRSGKIELPAVKQPAPGGEGSGREARRGDRTKRFDKHGDGTLSEAEREAMRDARREERMKRLDTDEDGKVPEEERALA